MNVEERLRGLGLELPEVPKPVAEYVPAKRVEELLECGRSCRRVMRVWRRPRPRSVTVGPWAGIGRGAVTTQDLIPWIERSVRAPERVSSAAVERKGSGLHRWGYKFR